MSDSTAMFANQWGADFPGPGEHGPRPDTIGPYKVLELLGVGGMGLVYLAEQTEPVRRQVAVKVIRPGLDTREVIARFEAERQALAMMDHPNIARVFEAGATEDGRPYFVMEVVRGLPITDHCDACRLSTQERLRLFALVCDAVHHAHQKGVIHRDIKPSNVLVEVQERQAIPKIIDFGVAKAISQPLTQRSLYTEKGQLIGTPEYMSPEQAEMTGLNIDTRTDIYSLGVLLYELIAGALPFDARTLRAAGFAEIQRYIREVDPPRPSMRLSALSAEEAGLVGARHGVDRATLVRELRDDLDWIVMKSIDKDRTRRYASASEFSSDIDRHLRHLPVIAGPPSAMYRARKFVRRRRGLVAAGGAVAAAIVLGLVGTTWQAIEARRGRDEAEAQRGRAEAALGVSRARLETGLELANRLVTDIDRRISVLPGSMEARKAIVESCAEYLRRLSEGAVDDPLVLDAEADLRTAMADIQGGLGAGNSGDAAAALENRRGALALRESLAGQDPQSAARRLDLATASLALGDALRTTGAPLDETKAAYLAAADEADAVLRASPSDDRAPAVSKRALLTTSYMLSREGRHSEALDACQRALEGARDAARSRPDEAAAQSSLMESLRTLGDLRLQAERAEEALTAYQEALGISEALAAKSEFNERRRRDEAWCHIFVGRALRAMDRHADAAESFRAALPILESIAGADASNVKADAEVHVGRLFLGEALIPVAAVDAQVELERARDGLTRHVERDPLNALRRRELLRAHNRLGELHCSQNRFDEALEAHARALVLVERLCADDPENALAKEALAKTLGQLGDAAAGAAAQEIAAPERGARRWTEAREWYARALDTLSQLKARGALTGQGETDLKRIADEIEKCVRALGDAATALRSVKETGGGVAPESGGGQAPASR